MSVNRPLHTTDGDLTIISNCRAGRETGWRGLYDGYAGYVFTICMRYGIKETDKDDTVQEIFAQLFKSFSSFTGEAEALKPWVRGVAVNVCLQYLRSQRRGFVDYAAELPASHEALPNAALDEMATDDILRLIARLPEPHRSIFNLSVIEGFPYSDIAKRLRLSEANCRQYLSRARKILRKQVNLLQQSIISHEK